MSVQVTRDVAVSICEELGFPAAGKWDKRRMSRKLKEVALLNDVAIEGNEELNDKLQEIVEAKGDVELVPKERVAKDKPAAEEPQVTHSEPEPEPAPAEAREETPAETPKKLTRFGAVARVFKELDGTVTLDEVAAAADDMYAKNGGKSNLKECRWSTTIVVQVLREFDLIKKQGKSFTRA